MCTQNSWAAELYQRHGETIENVLTNQVSVSIKEKVRLVGTSFLIELQSQWFNHQIRNKWLKKFFDYVDRYYVKVHNLRNLSDVGLHSFKKKVYDEIKRDTTESILNHIKSEREGEIIDKFLLKNCVEMFESMGMGSLCEYREELEAPLTFST